MNRNRQITKNLKKTCVTTLNTIFLVTRNQIKQYHFPCIRIHTLKCLIVSSLCDWGNWNSYALPWENKFNGNLELLSKYKVWIPHDPVSFWGILGKEVAHIYSKVWKRILTETKTKFIKNVIAKLLYLYVGILCSIYHVETDRNILLNKRSIWKNDS